MLIYASEFVSYLDEQGIKYSETDSENVFKVVYSGENLDTIPIYVFFDKDGEPYVQFKCWNIANFNNKKEVAIDLCNSLNAEWRWVKFYIDDDNDVVASIDAMVSLDSCGKECLNLVRRIVHIVDDAYPQIGKARWA